MNKSEKDVSIAARMIHGRNACGTEEGAVLR